MSLLASYFAKFLVKLELKQHYFDGCIFNQTKTKKKAEMSSRLVPLAPNSAGNWEFDRVVRRFLGDYIPSAWPH